MRANSDFGVISHYRSILYNDYYAKQIDFSASAAGSVSSETCTADDLETNLDRVTLTLYVQMGREEPIARDIIRTFHHRSDVS